MTQGMKVEKWQLSAPWFTPEKALGEIELLSVKLQKEDEPRAKIKLARQLAFAGTSLAVTDDKLDLTTIESGLQGLALANRFGAQTSDLNRAVAWLTKQKIELLGCSEFSVLTEKKKRIAVNAASLAVAGSNEIDTKNWYGNTLLAVDAMNNGEFFIVSTGNDGIYPVVARIIDASFPVLKEAEYKNLTLSSDTGIISVEGGAIWFGAPEDLSRGMKVDVEAGYYQVQLHVLERRSGESFVFVICPLQGERPVLSKFPELPY